LQAAERHGAADDMTGTPLVLNGVALVLDATGLVWHEASRTLIGADLHLEKGSAFARRGQLLPPYDTLASLALMSETVQRFDAARLILLGDSFHDRDAGARLPEAARTTLAALGAMSELVWITGNHDPDIPAGLPGGVAAEVRLGPLTLRHIPARDPGTGEIAGHLHPVARIRTRAGVVRRRCFVSDSRRLLLPAFGAYAGGLNVGDPAIADLFARPAFHALGARRVLPIAADRIG